MKSRQRTALAKLKNIWKVHGCAFNDLPNSNGRGDCTTRFDK